MNNQTKKTDLIPSSQVAYRMALGVLGMSFPFILWLGGALDGEGIQTSLSAYYYLAGSPAAYIPTARDIFVGVLFVIGVALYFYQGYEKKEDEPVSDNTVANIAGIAAFVVALSPTGSSDNVGAPIHSTAAAVFFLAITYFCWFVFTRGPKSEAKKKSNKIYKTCAVIMLSCIVLMAVIKVRFPDLIEDWNSVFWLESVALVAFGYAWWVKAATPVATILKHGPKKAIAVALAESQDQEETGPDEGAGTDSEDGGNGEEEIGGGPSTPSLP